MEPQAGHDLERLITALLNATGAVHRVLTAAEDRHSGTEVIEVTAERLRGILATLAEHMSDTRLALVTNVLAEVTLLIAEDLGLHHLLGLGNLPTVLD